MGGKFNSLFTSLLNWDPPPEEKVEHGRPVVERGRGHDAVGPGVRPREVAGHRYLR